MQVVGPAYDEPTALIVAAALEQIHPTGFTAPDRSIVARVC